MTTAFLISLLIFVLVLILIGWAANWLISRFLPGGTPATIARVIVGLLLLVALLERFGLLGGGSAVAT